MGRSLTAIPGGQWQCNSFPDLGCEDSFGYKCTECPYDSILGYSKCLDEYPVVEGTRMKRELKAKLEEVK